MGMALFWYYMSSVATGLFMLVVTGLLASGALLFIILLDSNVNGTENQKSLRISLGIFITSIVLLIFTPRYTFFYALAGYEASKYIANTEMGTKVQDLIIKKLEESINGKE